MKMKKRFLGILLSLVMVLGLMPGMSLTAHAADATVTWDCSQFQPDEIILHGGESTTKDGVTLKAIEGMAVVDPDYGFMMMGNPDRDSFEFSVAEGKITKIVIACSRGESTGTGWSGFTWTGSASSVIFGGYANNVTSITFTIAPAKQTQTITASDVTATYGDTDKSVSGTTTGDGAISYSVKSGDAVTVDENTGALTIVKAGSAVITVTAAETATYAQATKDVNVTVNTKAMTVSAENVNVTVDGQPHGITVNVTDPASGATVKYGTEVGTYNLDASPTQTEAGELTVYYQVTADNYTTYTGSAKVTVNAKQTQTITASDVTATYGDTDKSVSGTTTGDGAIGYSVKSGDAVTVDENTGALTIVKAGSAVITVTAAETATYAQATKEVAVTINKAAPTVTAPTAKTLTYNGQKQELVNAGSTNDGTLYYAVTTENKAPTDENLYDTSIPTATEAGTYYVWYKVKGDENHNDTDPVPLAVTISPVDKDALNKAIADTEAYYDTIKGKAEYADVAATLKKAIDAAKDVAANDNVTESAVAQAIKDINGATDKAKADVAAIDKQAADEAAAKDVIEAIGKLPAEAGLDDKAAVEAARKAYEALTEDQKKLVPEDVLKKLTVAEEQVKASEDAKAAEEEAAKKKQAEDEAAAKAVADAISALPAEAGLEDKAAVEAAQKAYDALTEDQKKLVPEDVLKRLATAEAQVEAADKQAADEAAAKAVADAISALPAEAGLEDKEAVEAARKAYDALTEDQKKLVPKGMLKKLATAEAQVEAAEEAAEVVSITKCRIAVKDRTYTGKVVKKPVVTVRYGKVKLKEGRDYTVTYNKKARKIGTYKLKVKGKGKYTGTKMLTFRIIPKGTVFTKRTGGNRQITLTWKERKNITGYQIEYSLKKDFSGSKKILVNKPKIFTKVIRNLKPGKTYYVRIRTYKKVNRKTYISLWSKTKTVKTSGVKSNAPAQVVEVALQAGETLDLNGLFPGGDAWESGNEAVVAVSDGVANALAAGEAVVDGLDAEGEEVRVVITVTESEIGIEGLELGADLSLPGIDDVDDGDIVMDEEIELQLD